MAIMIKVEAEDTMVGIKRYNAERAEWAVSG